MNVVVPLTNLGFLPEFYYPTVMQALAGRTVLEHAVDSVNIQGQYHFVLRWEDHTKYSLGNYIQATFPGALVHVVRERLHGDAEAVLRANVKDGPLVVFDAQSQLLFNSSALLNRVSQSRADLAVTVFNNHNKKFPHIRIGGYDRNLVSRLCYDRSNFALSGLYYFGDAKQYNRVAPQVVRDELEMEYREIGLDVVTNYLLDEGARCIYHRTGRKDLTTIDSLSKFE